MNFDLQPVIQSKEAERRRLRSLPWLEELEILDRLRDRPLVLRKMKESSGEIRPTAKPGSFGH